MVVWACTSYGLAGAAEPGCAALPLCCTAPARHAASRLRTPSHTAAFPAAWNALSLDPILANPSLILVLTVVQILFSIGTGLSAPQVHSGFRGYCRLPR